MFISSLLEYLQRYNAFATKAGARVFSRSPGDYSRTGCSRPFVLTLISMYSLSRADQLLLGKLLLKDDAAGVRAAQARLAKKVRRKRRKKKKKREKKESRGGASRSFFFLFFLSWRITSPRNRFIRIGHVFQLGLIGGAVSRAEGPLRVSLGLETGVHYRSRCLS